MIAVMVLAMVAVAILSTQMFASRAAQVNSNYQTARNIAQTYIEQMQASALTVGSQAYPTDGADPFAFIKTAYNTARTVTLSANGSSTINATVTCAFSGSGYLTSASKTTLTDSNASWKTNEWAGNDVCIVSGTGAGQYARISSNTANMLTLATSLTTVPSTSGSGSPIYNYRINNGVTVTVTVAWQSRGKQFSVAMKGLIIPSGSFSSN